MFKKLKKSIQTTNQLHSFDKSQNSLNKRERRSSRESQCSVFSISSEQTKQRESSAIVHTYANSANEKVSSFTTNTFFTSSVAHPRTFITSINKKNNNNEGQNKNNIMNISDSSLSSLASSKNIDTKNELEDLENRDLHSSHPNLAKSVVLAANSSNEEKDMKNLKEKYFFLVKSLSEKEYQILNLKKEIENLSLNQEEQMNQLNEINNEKTKLILKNGKIENENENNLIEISRLQMEINSLNSDHQSAVEVLKQQNQQHLHNINELRSEIDETKKERERQINRLTKTNEETIKEKNKIIKKLEQKFNDLKKLIYQEKINTTNISNNMNNNNINNDNNNNNANNNNNSNDISNYIKEDKDTFNIEKIQNKNEFIAEKSEMIRFYEEGAGVAKASEDKNINDHKELTNPLTDTNFLYLKHVLIKFMLSREQEALQLLRVISSLLLLSEDEERILKEIFEWKSSWFKARPHLKDKGQYAFVLPRTL